MNLTGTSILVTGGSGFIGSHLVDYIIERKPSQIVVLDNFFLGKEKVRNLTRAKEAFPELVIIPESAADRYEVVKILKDYDIRTVFNLAVVPLIASLIKPAWSSLENIDIVLSVCDMLKDGLYDHLIHFSSSEAYGTMAIYPMNEDHPLHAMTPYAASKAAGDALALSYWRTFDVDVSIVRPFNNYGPRQNEGSYAGVVPIFIKNIMAERQSEIHGDGLQTRDYIYVEDTAKLALDLVESGKTVGKVVNIAVGEEITINQMYDTIAQEMKYDKPAKHTSRRMGDVDRHCGDNHLLSEIIGHQKFTTFEEGIKKTVDWYKRYFEEYKLYTEFDPGYFFTQRMSITKS
ncbi:MAG: GDP-mannose 4,6-dehydratase [Candidatus Thorarchaeota archaeon]|nr:GDP-mannose 4,6-dehydratase [Candidatus Thorarchaeota archaeon]